MKSSRPGWLDCLIVSFMFAFAGLVYAGGQLVADLSQALPSSPSSLLGVSLPLLGLDMFHKSAIEEADRVGHGDATRVGDSPR